MIVERLGVKQKSDNNRKSKINKNPCWKRSLEKNTNERREDVSKLDEVEKGNRRLSMSEKQHMDREYQLDAKGYLYIIQQLKVKISRVCINIRHYNKN